MATSSTFKEVKDSISSALVDTTRTAGQISNEDLAFHRSSNPAIVPLLEEKSSRLLALARSLTKVATAGTEVSAPRLSDADSVEDNWKNVVDVFDNLLEKADACLDEYTGVIKRLSPCQEEQIQSATPVHGKQRPAKSYRSQNIVKPQLLFENIPKNDEISPFKPLIRSKPHFITPLEESLVLVDTEDGTKQYKHPYETEIKRLQYPAEARVKTDPILYQAYDSTKATLVDTPEAVRAMLKELKLAKEIAVDLEHHDEHSYIGLVSLMQISTRDKDWVVDTLKPWRQDLQILNEIFTDPEIIKVFHGAFMDMIWLQRDLGLYVVGLFDTFHASRCLGYPRHSLAYLLKRFADFDAAKQYQMADWRIRPLPEEMFNYARSDTHFLLYIYDNMRNELIDNSDVTQADGDLVEVVMNNSKAESLQRYERPLYDKQRGSGSTGWYNMLYRTPALFNREQFAVFKAVHHWRDSVARQEDESAHVVMPKRVLYNIARELPMDMPSLLGCSHPMSKPFQERREDLLGVIKQAKIAGATGPEMKEAMQAIGPDSSNYMVDISGAQTIVLSEGKNALTLDKQSEGALPIRSNSSRFWGPFAFSNMKSDQGLSDSLRLALPLPELNAQVFEDPKTPGTLASENPQASPGARVEHQYTKDRKPKQDDVFVVKQAGGSRKRKATALPEPPEPVLSEENGKLENGDEMELSIHDNQEQPQAEKDRKREEKRERRHERKRLKQERSMLVNDNAVDENGATEAFDYANAPSVLHSKKKQDGIAGASPSVNPYAKSMDAPKGMRKTKKEIGGKSFTYKS